MRRRAFSLVELLVVIAILVLLMALLAPRSTRFSAAGRSHGRGQAVGDQIALARQTAIAKNQIVTLRFSRCQVKELSRSLAIGACRLSHSRTMELSSRSRVL